MEAQVIHSGFPQPFVRQELVNNLAPWAHCPHTIRCVPAELERVDAFFSPHHIAPEGKLTVSAPRGAVVYIFSETHRDGGFPLLGWAPVKTARFQWVMDGQRGYELKLWKRSVDSDAALEVPVSSALIGGIAVCEQARMDISEELAPQAVETASGAEKAGGSNAFALPQAAAASWGAEGRLRGYSEALDRVHAELLALEDVESSRPEVLEKQLRGLDEEIVQVSCGLDAVDIGGGDTIWRQQRHELLERCRALEAWVARLRSLAEGGGTGGRTALFFEPPRRAPQV